MFGFRPERFFLLWGFHSCYFFEPNRVKRPIHRHLGRHRKLFCVKLVTSIVGASMIKRSPS